MRAVPSETDEFDEIGCARCCKRGGLGEAATARVELVRDHDIADGHSLDAVLRRALGRHQLDDSFLFVRTKRNDDLVRRKGRKSVADGETDVRLAGTSIHGFARELLGRVVGDPLRLTERFLVVGEPVEYALPYDWHHDLNCVGLPDMRTQNIVRMFDRADDEDVPAHDGNVAPGMRVRSEPLNVSVVPAFLDPVRRWRARQRIQATEASDPLAGRFLFDCNGVPVSSFPPRDETLAWDTERPRPLERSYPIHEGVLVDRETFDKLREHYRRRGHIERVC